MLAFSILLLSLIAGSNAVGFTRVTDSAAWQPRAGAGFAQISNDQSTSFRCYDDHTGITRTRAVTDFLILWGGVGTVKGEAVATNDVWIVGLANTSSPTWCFAFGVTIDYIPHPNYSEDSFTPLSQAASASAGTSVYVAGGISEMLVTNEVWYAAYATQYRWKAATFSAPWPARYGANMVADSNNALILVGGTGEVSSPNKYFNDAWMSTSNGNTWKELSSTWPGRLLSGLTSLPESLYYFGGADFGSSEFLLNDVWTMPSNSKVVKQITDHAPWSARANHVVVNNGTTTLLMGGQSLTALFNDIWLTSDVVNWKPCVKSADWDARGALMSTIDKNGQVWVVGGADASKWMNDVWQSKWTITDPQCSG